MSEMQTTYLAQSFQESQEGREMTTEEKIQRAEVARAWAEGKALQHRSTRGEHWYDFDGDDPPSIFHELIDWRLKPDPPKPREWWYILPKTGVSYACFESRRIAEESLRTSVFPDQYEIIHVIEVL